MDIQQLRYFTQAARRGSFREAAEELFITRAALSKSVAQLEAELGYDLFVRTREGVGLTDAGRRFCPRAEELVEAFDRLEADMKRERDVSTIVVRFPNSWYEHFSDRVEEFRRAHEDDVRLVVECGSDAETVAAITAGRAQVAVTHLPVEGMLDEGKPLAHSPLYIAMSARNPLAAKASVGPADMEGQNVLYYSCGFEKVFWVPSFPGAGSYSNDLMHIYSCVFRNEAVLPTPLFTVPQFQRDIEYRRFDGPGSDVVMYGYVSPLVKADARLMRACLELRDALVCD